VAAPPGSAPGAGRPLEGVLVVALEQAVAAPLCSSRLADAGARVIKVERPGGDFARGYDRAVHGESAYFVWLNRGKESLVADIKDPGDRALIERIVARADVFVQNLAPGAAARAGLGSAALRSLYPRLVTCDVSGYGEAGAYAGMKAYDLLVQAESGLCSVTGTAEAMGRVGVSVCDIACGLAAYTAILEALHARARTGRGASVECSLFSSVAEWMAVPLLHHDYGGQAPPRVGLRHPSIHPYGAYATRDGDPVLIAIQNQAEFERFAEIVLGRPELAPDPRFADNVARCRHAAELDALIERCFEALSRPALLERLRRARVAFGEVNEVAGLSCHPALRRVEVETPGGPVALPAPPAAFDGAPRALGRVPALDEHGAAIRREFAAPECAGERG